MVVAKPTAAQHLPAVLRKRIVNRPERD